MRRSARIDAFRNMTIDFLVERSFETFSLSFIISSGFANKKQVFSVSPAQPSRRLGVASVGDEAEISFGVLAPSVSHTRDSECIRMQTHGDTDD